MLNQNAERWWDSATELVAKHGDRLAITQAYCEPYDQTRAGFIWRDTQTGRQIGLLFPVASDELLAESEAFPAIIGNPPGGQWPANGEGVMLADLFRATASGWLCFVHGGDGPLRGRFCAADVAVYAHTMRNLDAPVGEK